MQAHLAIIISASWYGGLILPGKRVKLSGGAAIIATTVSAAALTAGRFLPASQGGGHHGSGAAHAPFHLDGPGRAVTVLSKARRHSSSG